MRTTPVERSPTGLSRGLGVGAGVVAATVAVAYSSVGGLVALAGLALVSGGLVAGTHRLVTAGAVGILAGVLYAGLAAAPTVALLAAVGATVVAWDVAGFAIDLGAQLGREAETARVELGHAVASVAVATTSAGVGYGVYLAAAGGQPMAALLLLLLAGLLLVATLDQS